VPGKNPHTGEPQGELLRHPPGSNGEVRRGPDLKPRNLMRAVCLKAMTDPGPLALPPASKRSGAAKRERAEAKHAMIHNLATAFQGIVLAAAEGDPVARGQMLRLVHDFHEILQPTQDEAKSGGGPILPNFTRPTPAGSAGADDRARRRSSGGGRQGRHPLLRGRLRAPALHGA